LFEIVELVSNENLCIDPSLDVGYVGEVADDGQASDAEVKHLEPHEWYHMTGFTLNKRKSHGNNCIKYDRTYPTGESNGNNRIK